MATTMSAPSQREDDPSTEMDEGHPLKPNELQAIRRRDAAGGLLAQMDVPRLLDHITWLNDRLERVQEDRDSLRDRIAAFGPAQVFAQNLDTVK